ncbi:MAG: PD-(D/E)XK nuclease family protein [Candidatus Hodarchaeota archaeon]
MPDKPFTDPFYIKASSLQLPKLQAHKRVALRKRLERSGAIKSDINDDLVLLLRQYHRARNDLSYSADHSILTHFLDDDPKSIAIEVPVWSDRYRMSGHIDLVRYVDGGIQVCDYKPGKLETTKDRFLYSIPQVAAYGEMMAHHLASTLRSAIEAPLLPKVECCIFDTHACWRFGAELFVTLRESGHLTGV